MIDGHRIVKPQPLRRLIFKIEGKRYETSKNIDQRCKDNTKYEGVLLILTRCLNLHLKFLYMFLFPSHVRKIIFRSCVGPSDNVLVTLRNPLRLNRTLCSIISTQTKKTKKIPTTDFTLIKDLSELRTLNDITNITSPFPVKVMKCINTLTSLTFQKPLYLVYNLTKE